MSDEEEKDHRSCKAVLKIFCEKFAALDKDEQDKVETLINCNIRPLNTIYDLLELLIQRDKYYVLNGVNTNRKLGEFHIFVARRNYPDSWIAQKDFSEAKIVAKRVKQIEKVYSTETTTSDDTAAWEKRNNKKGLLQSLFIIASKKSY